MNKPKTTRKYFIKKLAQYLKENEGKDLEVLLARFCIMYGLTEKKVQLYYDYLFRKEYSRIID